MQATEAGETILDAFEQEKVDRKTMMLEDVTWLQVVDLSALIQASA